jgi:hypothetical protein
VTFQGRARGFVLGATAADPARRTLESAIMSLEGIVLFQARHDGAVTVTRAIDLFGSPDFARAMMEDIALIFFQPEADGCARAAAARGALCRYRRGHDVLDVLCRPDGSWEKTLYRQGKKIRTINAGKPGSQGHPEELELVARGDFRYHLNLRLISAD